MKLKAIEALVANSSLGYIGIYGLGTDGAMYHKQLRGSAWLPSKTEWRFLGGQFDSVPVAFTAPFTLGPFTELLGLGAGYGMFRGSIDAFQWPPSFAPEWESLGGAFNSPPDTVSFGNLGSGLVAIVGLGTDNQPYVKLGADYPGAWWPSISDWAPLDGRLIYEPALAYESESGFHIFGIGEDGQMYHLIVHTGFAPGGSFMPPTTSGWQASSGCFTSPPVVRRSSNQISVFGLGTDHAMYRRVWENGGWTSDWEFLGGEFDSVPAVVSWDPGGDPNHLDILGLGTDDQMYHKALDGGRWLPSRTRWQPIGGIFTSAPTACASSNSNGLHVFGLGTDFQMYHKQRKGNQWLPSLTDWEPIGGVFRIPRPTLLPPQRDFDWPITFSDGTALGGWLRVTLFEDGRASFSGHLHDSGADSYACSVGCAAIDAKDRAYTFFVSGNVWGALPGPRDHDWNVTTQHSSVRDNWSDLLGCAARFGARIDTQSFPPGGMVINLSTVLNDLGWGGGTVIPLVGPPP